MQPATSAQPSDMDRAFSSMQPSSSMQQPAASMHAAMSAQLRGSMQPHDSLQSHGSSQNTPVQHQGSVDPFAHVEASPLYAAPEMMTHQMSQQHSAEASFAAAPSQPLQSKFAAAPDDPFAMIFPVEVIWLSSCDVSCMSVLQTTLERAGNSLLTCMSFAGFAAHGQQCSSIQRQLGGFRRGCYR